MNPLEFIDMHLIIPSLLLLFGLFCWEYQDRKIVKATL